MNNHLPAALVSIKRYGPTMILFDDGWKAGMSEKKNGEFYPVDDIAQLFATLPPRGLSESKPAIMERNAILSWLNRATFSDKDFVVPRDMLLRLCNTALAADAAPPADSAMVDALQAFIDAITEKAARDAYDADLGVSEWPSFVPRYLVAPLECARTLLAGRK